MQPKTKFWVILAVSAIALYIAGKFLWDRKQAEKKASDLADLSDPAKMNTGVVLPPISTFSSPAANDPVGQAFGSSGQQQQQQQQAVRISTYMN